MKTTCRKAYKENVTSNTNMIPSDPTGSLDDFPNSKLLKSLICGGTLWKK